MFMAGWPEEPPDGSQSVRSSVETGNDRGAKGRRKVAAQGPGTATTNRRQWRQRLNKSAPTAPREGRLARWVRAERRWPQLTTGESADRRGLRRVGRRPWRRHTAGCGPSYDYAPTDWRAGCGRSARPVRREGLGSIPGPYLYLFAAKIAAPGRWQPSLGLTNWQCPGRQRQHQNGNCWHRLIPSNAFAHTWLALYLPRHAEPRIPRQVAGK